jgi:hypothetical protein
MHRSTHGAAVVNFFDGRCYVAASPLLGTTSVEGESWTLLGNKLIERSAFDTVILVPAAIGGSSIVRWQQGADLNTMLLGVLAGLKSSSYTPTHILWHQGESNFVEGTSAQDYTRMFQSLLTSIRQQGVHAPIFVSVATRCAPPPPWVADNPVSRAQRALPDAHQQIFAGVNTDSLITTADRRDGCHFGASGQEKFADAWNTIL